MAVSKREDLGQIVIRPPAGMRERIKAAAEANNRSMNAEIVATLEEKYPAPPDVGFDVELTAMSDWLEYIDAAPNDVEFEQRLSEVNSRLSRSSTKRKFIVRVFDDEESGIRRALYVTRSGLLARDMPIRTGGKTLPPTR